MAWVKDRQSDACFIAIVLNSRLYFCLATVLFSITSINCGCCECTGLRTLCLAVADIDEKFYAEWNEIYQKASTSVHQRQERIDEAAELLEKVVVVLFNLFLWYA